MLKKLLSLMLFMTITSTAFCMEALEEKNQNSGKTEEQKELKRLAKANDQEAIINLIQDLESLHRNLDLIFKLIEKFNLEKVLKHIDKKFYDMRGLKLSHYTMNGHYKLVQVFYPDLKTKEEIDSGTVNNIIRQALYLANGLEEYNDYGETNIMYLIKANQFEEAAELIQHSSTDYILAQDVEGKTALYYAVKKFTESKRKVPTTKFEKAKLDKKIESLETVMVALVAEGASWNEGYSDNRPKSMLIKYYEKQGHSTHNATVFADLYIHEIQNRPIINPNTPLFVPANYQGNKIKNKLQEKTKIWSKIKTKQIIAGGAIIACLAGIIYLALSGKSENIVKNIGTK